MDVIATGLGRGVRPLGLLAMRGDSQSARTFRVGVADLVVYLAFGSLAARIHTPCRHRCFPAFHSRSFLVGKWLRDLLALFSGG